LNGSSETWIRTINLHKILKKGFIRLKLSGMVEYNRLRSQGKRRLKEVRRSAFGERKEKGVRGLLK
jgi:hypothetical protein